MLNWKTQFLLLGMLVVVGSANAASLADVQVVERASGRVLPVHRHGGEYWIAGQPGRNYEIRINNRLDERLMAVISVDGVNVITGQSASSQPRDGYVFEAMGQSAITGWRKSDDTVAAFYFSYKEASYASRTGRPQDVGAIGVALFREKQVMPAPRINSSRNDAKANQAEIAVEAPVYDSDAAAQAPQASMARRRAESPASRLGTGHGAIEASHVEDTEFTSATTAPEQIVRLRYDSYANLVARGVIRQPATTAPIVRQPNPFPQDGYVPDPPR